MYPDTSNNGLQKSASIDNLLSEIVEFIGSEIKVKQDLIERLFSQVQEKDEAISLKDQQISALREKLAESQQTAEGLHQLMNKLLNDCENYQKDIDWYKRTYEKRSLLGVLKEKLFRPSKPGYQQP